MKAKVLTSKKIERSLRTVPKTVEAGHSFEEDWKNGISGEEVVKRVHKHIENLYASRKKL